MELPRYPSQPLPFLAWLATEITSHGSPCAAAMFERGGALSLMPPSGGRLMWLTPGSVSDRVFYVEGVVGAFLGLGVESALTRGLAHALSQVIATYNPLPLAFGPETGPVFFTPSSLGNLLRRHLSPGVTRWGPYLFQRMTQPEPRCLDLFFTDGGLHELIFRLTLQGTMQADYRREDIVLERLKDSRGPKEIKKIAYQVERLISFSLGRALAYNPPILLDLPTPLTPDPPKPPPVPAEKKRSLEELLNRVRFPHELGEEVFFRPWGGNFVANEMLLHSPGLGVLVCHSNRECLCATIPPTGSYERYHCCPWPRDMEDPEARLLTDFDDLAAAYGGQERLEAAILRAIERSRGRPIFVIEMCEYQAMGEDVDGVVRRVREQQGCWILTHDNVFTEGPLAGLDNRWIPVLTSLLRKDVERDPRGVVLCGYCLPGSTVHRELADLLSAFGVNLHAVVFPYVDPEAATAISSASLWVLNPWLVVEKGLGQAVDTLGLNSLRAPAPFGLAGTRRWLEKIVASLGLPEIADARFEQAILPMRPVWEGLCTQLTGRRVAFVVPSHEARTVLEPRVFYGLDPIAMLSEMGMTPCIIATGDQEPLLQGIEVVRPLPREHITETLLRSGCDLVYSDYADDWRVLAAGAMPFGIRHVEFGLSGTMRTARRLLWRCRTPFFRRYARFLAGGWR